MIDTVEIGPDREANACRAFNIQLANRILHHVAEQYNQDITAFTNPRRTRPLSYMRFTAMAMLHSYVAGISWKSISKLVGREDHTTAMRAIERVQDFIKQQDELFYPTYINCITSFKH